eukprot:5510717-Prymnesium_polylepis.2
MVRVVERTDHRFSSAGGARRTSQPSQVCGVASGVVVCWRVRGMLFGFEGFERLCWLRFEVDGILSHVGPTTASRPGARAQAQRKRPLCRPSSWSRCADPADRAEAAQRAMTPPTRPATDCPFSAGARASVPPQL